MVPKLLRGIPISSEAGIEHQARSSQKKCDDFSQNCATQPPNVNCYLICYSNQAYFLHLLFS